MISDDHLAVLKQGADVWNAWRLDHLGVQPNLSRSDVGPLNLPRVNLQGAALVQSDLTGIQLEWANLVLAHIKDSILRNADLTSANLHDASLTMSDLRGACLNHADLMRVDLSFTKLMGTDFTSAKLGRANFLRADATGAKFLYADMRFSDLDEADLTGADLCETNLTGARLHRTNLKGARLSGSRVYGISVWDIVTDDKTEQADLIISPEGDPTITVDSLEVAQFVYLLLKNERIREVIDTITSKVVLILGRFTSERKAVLDALRQELRRRDYVPILFDFEVPHDRDITETITLLARMARFIVADLSEASSIPKELEAFVPDLAVPVQPLLAGSGEPYSMFRDYWKYDWVLPVYRYNDVDSLLASLKEHVIEPAENKVLDLRLRRPL
jgi:uncharacterized protein YjbI with pentapeptide repeats